MNADALLDPPATLPAAPALPAWRVAPAALMDTYAPSDVEFVAGRGATLWDAQGRAYLDAIAGVGVSLLGHAHPALVAAIADQAGRLLHVSNLCHSPWAQQLAERLTALSGLRRAFFCNSGAEANEAALKLARLHAQRRGVAQPLVLVMDGGFHGRTLATLSASASPAVRAGFGPHVEGFLRLPFGDLAAVAVAQAAHGDRIVALLVEPVQGEGGVHLAPPGYLRGLRTLCSQHGWLLMLDEVQTGLGRTGRWFAGQHEDVQPDVMTLAKGLAGGVPIGACLAGGAAAELFTPGSHGSTFGGNPLACRAACTVLDVMAREDLVARAAQRGQALLAGLQAALAGDPRVRAVRGLGLMIGIELDRPARELALRALQRHRLLINVTQGTVIRLLPPLVLTVAEAQAIVSAVVDLVKGMDAG